MPLDLGRNLLIGGFLILAFMIPMTDEETVQASPMQVCYYRTDQSLSNQSVIITDMDDRGSVVCAFSFTTAPHRVNCTQPGTFVCVKNESYVQMFTKGQKTKNCMMEYGSGRNGHHLQATCEDVPEEKVPECFKSADSSPQPQLDDGSNHTVWIILGVLLIVAVLAFFTLYISCKRFRSRVNAAFSRLRGCVMRSGIETGTTSNTNTISSPNEGYVPVLLAPIERG